MKHAAQSQTPQYTLPRNTTPRVHQMVRAILAHTELVDSIQNGCVEFHLGTEQVRMKFTAQVVLST